MLGVYKIIEQTLLKMAKSLTKSGYTNFRRCEKLLWMNINMRQEAIIDASLQARLDTGSEVGKLARGYLGNYKDVTTFDSNGNPDIDAMIKLTQDYIDAVEENIAEAAFSWDGNYCAVDILHKTPDGYAIYEVKSSSGKKDNSPKKKKKKNEDENKNKEELLSEMYARDIAYQKYVLSQCGINVTGTYLVRINSDYVRGKELDIKQLFYDVDISEQVAEEYPLIPESIEAAKKILAQKEEPDKKIGHYCYKPYDCVFRDYCIRHQGVEIPENSVFDLYKMNYKDKIDAFYNGRIGFENQDPKVLNNNIRKLQIECTLNGTNHIDKEGIREFLGQLSYPLYFLDFETMNQVVPPFEGTKPNQQIPFQYSLHYIEKQGGKLEHKEFLGVSGENPLRAIAESICNDIPMNVCTIAYHKSFECSRLKELAKMFPDLAEHLRSIKDNIKDLEDPFSEGYYYEPAMKGSFSIKSVLPALFPNDPALNYQNLSGGVKNGQDAMNIFPAIKDMSPDKQKQARQALLDYCKLDTLAMVKIWEKLVEKAK